MKAAAIRLAAAGRAYQSVAQSAAIAIQDGTDYLRNVSTIATAGIGAGIAQLVAGNSNGSKVISAAQQVATAGVTQFSAIGTAATGVASEFPSSFG